MSSTDPNFSYCKLLMPLEGANNNVAFVDYSPSNKVVSVYGNARISSLQSKWGNGSGLFDGSGDYAVINDQNGLAFGTGDFCIGGHIFPSSVSGYHVLMDFRPTRETGNYLILDILNGYLRVLVGATTKIVSSVSIAIDTWVFFRLKRASGGLSLRLNSTIVGTAYAAENLVVGTNRPVIGVSGYDLLYGYSGNIQDIAVHNVAAYSDAAPVPGRLVVPAFPDYSSTIAVSGNATVSGGGPVDYVSILDADDNAIKAAEATTDGSGDWSADIPTGSYYFLFVADGYPSEVSGPHAVSESGVSPAIPNIVLGGGGGTAKTVGYAF